MPEIDCAELLSLSPGSHLAENVPPEPPSLRDLTSEAELYQESTRALCLYRRPELPHQVADTDRHVRRGRLHLMNYTLSARA